MNYIVTPEHRKVAEKLRELLATYVQSEDLIQIGAYKRGSSREIDEAIRYYPKIISFLKQDVHECYTINESVQQLFQLIEQG